MAYYSILREFHSNDKICMKVGVIMSKTFKVFVVAYLFFMLLFGSALYSFNKFYDDGKEIRQTEITSGSVDLSELE